MMDDRLTRCPHCSTSFTVSDAELHKAFGVARCGRCKKIFNAANHLFELEPADTSESQHSEPTLKPSPRVKSPAQSQAESQINKPEVAVAEAIPPVRQPASKPSDAEPDFGLSEPAPVTPAEPRKTVQMRQQEPDDIEALLAELSDAPQLDLDTDELTAIRKLRQAPQVRQQQLEISLTADREDEAPTLTNSFHFSAEPDEIPKANEHKAKPSTGLPWIPATLAAALIALILLILWSNTRTLSQSPGLAGFSEAICSLSQCDHFLPSDFDGLQVGQHVLRETNTQLTAEFVLTNPAENALPFPAVLVELRDDRGKVISEQLFQPDTYLKGLPFNDRMLPAGLPLNLALTLGGQAQGIQQFSLRFFPAAD